MSNILNKIQLSGTTYDLVDSSAVHSLEGYATEQYVTAATNALAESIASQHYQTSGDVQNAISGRQTLTTFIPSSRLTRRLHRLLVQQPDRFKR